MNVTGKILLAGATGYVGGRLANALTERGYKIRCMARRPEEAVYRLPKLAEIVKADVLVPDTLSPALEGIETAFYLIHSMEHAEDFKELDRHAAENFAFACARAGVKRILYLGGLGDDSDKLSSHLESRHEVGQLLRSDAVETLEFRASIIIGSGSLSFEMVRALTEKLPIMITPKWVRLKAQPIGIQDVLAYLMAAIELPFQGSRIIEIGGRDIVSYCDLMKEYAKLRGLKRIFLPVPLLTPKLSSLWLGLVTPLYARTGHKLITSIKNSTVVTDTESAKDFSISPMSMKEAMNRALLREDQEYGNTHWSDALSSLGKTRSWAGVRFGNRIVDSRVRILSAPPSTVFRTVERIGGETGWYFANFLWRVRGFLDRLVGGPGLRRGRRHPVKIQVGDAIDFWRVEAFEPDKRLSLRAEMKLPGRAWLEFSVEPDENHKTQLRQTAIFDPIGLKGRLYWYGLYPIHSLIFRNMLRNMAESAEEED